LWGRRRGRTGWMGGSSRGHYCGGAGSVRWPHDASAGGSAPCLRSCAMLRTRTGWSASAPVLPRRRACVDGFGRGGRGCRRAAVQCAVAPGFPTGWVARIRMVAAAPGWMSEVRRLLAAAPAGLEPVHPTWHSANANLQVAGLPFADTPPPSPGRARSRRRPRAGVLLLRFPDQVATGPQAPRALSLRPSGGSSSRPRT
jgi:hypothetical protein